MVGGGGGGLSLAGAATSIIFVATNVLSRQAYFCRNKDVNTFVATKIYLWHLPPMIGEY